MMILDILLFGLCWVHANGCLLGCKCTVLMILCGDVMRGYDENTTLSATVTYLESIIFDITDLDVFALGAI